MHRRFFGLTLLLLMMTATLFGKPKRILCGSSIRQSPDILFEFLHSLNHLEKESYELEFYFVDDNTDPLSSKVLQDFQDQHVGKCYIRKVKDLYSAPTCERYGWREAIVWKIAGFKNEMIEYARDHGYDYLFLIDSDTVLHAKTIEQLLSVDQEIVSEIIWTRWNIGTIEIPQIPIEEFYTQDHCGDSERLTPEQKAKKFNTFYDKLREPGTYEVGGVAACTLVKDSALKKGISFSEIKNISFWGEERHFSIRAAALGIKLYMDTHYPVFHIFREEDLAEVPYYFAKSHNIPINEQWLNQWSDQRKHLPKRIYHELGIARALEKSNAVPSRVIEAYKKTIEHYPCSPIPVYYLSQFYRFNQNRNDLAYALLQKYELVRPPVKELSELHWIFDWGLETERSLCSFWTGEYGESVQSCRRLLANPRVPPNWHTQTKKNLKFALDALKN